LDPSGGEQRANKTAHAGEDVTKTVREGLADGEDNFKDAHDYEQKKQRAPDAMEENVVNFAGAFHGEWRAVAGAAADLGCPGVGAGRVAYYGELERMGGFALGLLMEEERYCVETGSVDGADLGYGRAKLASEFEGIDFAAAGFHEVAHVEQYQSGQAERENRRG
jgi:hypothetical protein